MNIFLRVPMRPNLYSTVLRACLYIMHYLIINRLYVSLVFLFMILGVLIKSDIIYIQYDNWIRMRCVSVSKFCFLHL